MGIIPLIIGGDGKNVVDKQEDFDIEGNSILILNRDNNQLQEPNETNICYDLRVGTKYRDHRDREPTTLGKDDKFLLRPQAAVIIETEECVHLPRSMFGYILPKVSLLQKGVSNTASKIDPGYYGPLLVTLFNLGRQTFELSKGDKFCSLHIAKIEGKAKLRQKPPQQIQGEGKGGVFQFIGDKLRDYDSYVKLILLFGEIILLILGIIAFSCHKT